MLSVGLVISTCVCVCVCVCVLTVTMLSAGFVVSTRVCVLEMQQYGSTPYCILPLSVLQYIAVLQYLTLCL